MKHFYKVYSFILILICYSYLNANAQTKSQFNGQFNIGSIIAQSTANEYEIDGQFSDGNNVYSASDVAVGDIIIDPKGNAYTITTIISVVGSTINTISTDPSGANFPTGGTGIIYQPTRSGFPLITNDTPTPVLTAALNTTTISVDANMRSYSSGISLPTSSYSSGAVVLYNESPYILSGSSWTKVTTYTSVFAMPSDPGTAGDVAFNLFTSEYYYYDGSSWQTVSSVDSLPSTNTYGDVFYNTTEQKLYMYDAAGNWVCISSATVPSGTSSDMPTSGNPGDFYFDTDNNILYVYDAFARWIQVSINGSTPSGIVNPDVTNDHIKVGTLFFNTSDSRLYVYNGTDWNAIDNTLASGKIYVGNSSNIATAVAVSGDVTISSSGKITIQNAAVTDSKLDKSNIPLSGFGIPTDNIALGNGTTNYKITYLSNPTSAQDAATKNYVDALFSSPATLLALPSGNLFVGNTSGKAAAVAKSSIPLSGFGNATAAISMGDGTTNYRITNVANPTSNQDAATKYYVDNHNISPSNILLTQNYLLVGNTVGVAAATAKSSILLSGFGAAAADVALGGYKLTGVADPVSAQDAATKNYVDTKTIDPASINLTSGDLLVGNTSGKAADVAKSSIPLSGFGAATSDVALGGYKLTGVADPVSAQDAVTKNYLETQLASPSSSLALPLNYIFVGNAAGKAASINKASVPLSDFGAATANVAMGNSTTQYNINYLSDPLYAQDAATKNYVDNTVANPGSISLSQNYILVGNASGKAEATAINSVPVSSFGTANADISLGNNKITDLVDPTADQDAATKKYVDSKAGSTTTTEPTSPTAGSTYYNTTDSTFYVYNGSAWMPVDNKLYNGQLYVGNASNIATSTAKSSISLSGFGAAKDTVNMGGYRLVNLADPLYAQNAATKTYVDNAISGISTVLTLAKGNMFVGDASGKAVSTPKSSISISGFGDAEANVSMGTGSNNYKIINLAEPTGDQDAATKKYVDSKTATISTTEPTSPTAGSTYYNTTDSTFYVYNGSAWVPVDNKLPQGELYVGNASDQAEATAKSSIPLSGFGAATADVALGSFKLTGVADPTADQDAATKKYVDTKAGSTTTTQPTSPTAGSTYYNTSDSTFYVYNGSAWVPVDNKLPQGELYVGNASNQAAATAKSAITLSGFGDAEANVSMGTGSNNYKIINLADPSGDQDAATKKYVDGKSGTTTTTQPTNPTTGSTYYNTTDSTLYVYNGSTWTPAVLGDNLGNHTATKNIKTSTFAINNDGQDGKGLTFETAGNATFAQDVTVKGNFYTPSDQRLKTKIETLSKTLQAIDQLRGVRFEYKDQKRYAKGFKIGVIAQELQKIFPEMVTMGSDGYLKVDYTQLTAVLIQAVKEQQVQINELNNRLNKQQEQINSILQKLDKSR